MINFIKKYHYIFVSGVLLGLIITLVVFIYKDCSNNSNYNTTKSDNVIQKLYIEQLETENIKLQTEISNYNNVITNLYNEIQTNKSIIEVKQYELKELALQIAAIELAINAINISPVSNTNSIIITTNTTTTIRK